MLRKPSNDARQLYRHLIALELRVFGATLAELGVLDEIDQWRRATRWRCADHPEEGGPQHTMSRVGGRIDATMTRALEYLIALGAAWSLLWWGGYALAKRAVGSGYSHRAGAHG